MTAGALFGTFTVKTQQPAASVAVAIELTVGGAALHDHGDSVPPRLSRVRNAGVKGGVTVDGSSALSTWLISGIPVSELFEKTAAHVAYSMAQAAHRLICERAGVVRHLQALADNGWHADRVHLTACNDMSQGQLQSLKDKYKFTPLKRAIGWRHAECVKILREHRAAYW